MNPHTSQAIGVDPTQIMQLTIQPASRFDTEGILNCLSSAFQPYRNRYTPAAFMDTILDADLLVARMQVMRVLVAVVDSKIVGTVAGGVSTPGEGHLRRDGCAASLQGSRSSWSTPHRH